MRRSFGVLGLLGAVSMLTGCHGFAPASLRTQELARAMELSARVPADQFLLEIESPYLAGIYDVLFAAEGATMRVQLFPDVGGKVLDVTVRPGEVTSTMPGQTYRAVAPLDEAQPHLALVLAAMLAELAEPVTPDRVLGERACGDHQLEVQLLPALGAGQVHATLGPDGRIRSYQFGLGTLSFRLDSTGEFAGRGFSGKVCP